MTFDHHQADEQKKRHSHHLFDLRGLLESLQHLYLQISDHLMRRRINLQPGGKAGREADIRATLENRLEQVAFEAREYDAAQATTAQDAVEDNEARERPSFLASLSAKFMQPFRRRRHGADLQPHMSEKMQAATRDHINKAQRQARLGNMQSAQLYAGLAENAMETAGQYMDDEEFVIFKADVEARIRSIDTRRSN